MHKEQKQYHVPVLVDQVVDYMNLKPGGIYLDATFGGGGHTRAFLENEPNCTVIGLDWDLYALETNGAVLQEQYPGRLKLVWGNFSQLDRKIKKVNVQTVDGILADFGTSQYQLLQRPGFSFYKDSPLDMRMAPAHQKITAADIINNASESELLFILQNYGQEHKARSIVRLIAQEREKKPITTTKQLADLVERVTGQKGGRKIHPATKVFQALRIQVNNELDNINAFFQAALRVLNPGGRLLCISFHSLEDRLVKNFFKTVTSGRDARAQIVTAKPVIASPDEVAQNPSARSAKMRVLQLV